MRRVVLDREPMTDAEVGGKFARQHRMAAAGLRVPRFYCLTVAWYERLFAGLEADVAARLARTDWTRADRVRAASQEIEALFARAPLSAAEEAEALAPFDALLGPDALVAVRGSMVGHRREESEDSAEHAFAGMSESVLCVRRDGVLAALRRVWASGFSPEALLYRRAHGMDPLGFSVAAGVQEMVLGERSFVMFTCDPKTAARDTVIVAAYGLGEGVVQEKVACDHFFVRGKTGAIERTLAPKEEALALDLARGEGVVARPVPEDARDAPCLSDDELRALAALGARVEALFGAPQDVEGTVRDGEVVLLQARPIGIDFSRQRVWTNANVTESFPGVTTALTYSFARFFYRVIFYDCYRRLGVGQEELRANDGALASMIGFLRGRVYYNLTSFYLLHRQSPLFPVFERHWVQMMGFSASYSTAPGGAAARAWRRVRTIGRVGYHAVRFLWGYARHRARMRAFHRWWEALFGPLRGRRFEGDDPLATKATFDEVWRQVGAWWGLTLLNDTYLPLIYGLVEGWFARWGLAAADPSLLSDLLCGDEQLTSVEVVLSAVSLAEHVRADPTLRAAFAERGPEALWAEVEAEALPARFCAQARAHLHRYGDRGLQELELEQPSLRDDPPALLRSVQRYAATDVTVEGLRAAERVRRADGEARLRRALRGHPLRRLLLRWALGTLRELVRSREDSRYCRSELFGFSRRVFQGIEAHLVREGVLRGPGEVYHLTQEEVFGYVDGTGVTEDLQALADLRRRERAAHQEGDLPQAITTLGPVRPALAAAGAGAAPLGEEGALRGLGSSPGRVRGTARVVLDPTAEVEVTPDMILVARETDPGWLFLMLAAKGIVVERGSMLSHTAITGRKFGIPTVVAVPGATARIADGAALEIDGATGVVTLLEPDAEAAS